MTKIFSRIFKAEQSDAASSATHHHVMPLPLYFAIFGALLFLTVVTVGVSHLGLPQPYAIIVAMIVAIIKATLVAAFFMHLKYDTKFNILIFVGSLFFLSLFFGFTIGDLEGRDHFLQEERLDYYRSNKP